MAYSGFSIVIPCGQGSYDGNSNTARIPIENLTDATNIIFEGDAWRKAGGIAAFDVNAIAGTPNLIEAIDWHPSAGVQRIVSAWSNGNVYKETSGNIDAVTLVSGLTATGTGIFVEGGQETAGANRKLFYFSEGNAPRVLSGDGVVMTTIATPSADWSGANQPTAACIHAGRLAAAGNPNYPHGVYFSGLTNHEDFVTGSPPIVSVFPGEGEGIRAIFSFLPSRLYVWKFPRGLYFIDTTGAASNWYALKVRDDVGMAGPRGVGRASNDVIFISSVGSIHSLAASDTSEDIIDSDISAALNLENFLRDSVSTLRLKFAKVLYDQQRKEVHVAFTAKDQTINGSKILADVSRPGIRVAPDRRESAATSEGYYESLFLYREADGLLKVYGGGTGGKIHKMNQATRSTDGVAYNAEFETPDTDFAFAEPELGALDKRFDYLEVTVTPTGNYNMSFDTIIDGVYQETISMNLGSTGAALGSFLLGTDRFGGTSIINHKERIHGRGRRLRLRGYNSALNQDFSISEMRVHMKTAGMKGER